jgi:hypothetical protein
MEISDGHESPRILTENLTHAVSLARSRIGYNRIRWFDAGNLAVNNLSETMGVFNTYMERSRCPKGGL